MLKRIILSIKIMNKSAKWFCAIKVLFMLVSALSVPFSVYVTEKMITSITNIGQPSFSLFVTIKWIVIFALINYWMILQVHANHLVQTKTIIRLKETLLPVIAKKVCNIQYSHFEDPAVKDIFYRLQDSPHDLVLSIFDTTLIFLRDTISILGIAYLFTRISWRFFIIFLIILVPVLWCDYRSTIIIQRMHREQSYAERELAYYDDLLSNKYALHELKIMNSIKYIQKVWNNKAQIVLGEHIKTTTKSQLLMLSSTLLLLVFSALVMGLLLKDVIARLISIGVFISLVNSIQSIYSISFSLSDSITSLSRKSYQIEYIEKLLSMTEAVVGTQKISTEKCTISFDHVNFTYPNTEKRILKDVTFTISPNEKVCIVGRNGAGKSTIIKLLCGLYTPDSGSIRVNGININDVAPDSVKKIRSVVFQDYFKYFSTIRENVSYGNIDQKFNDSEIKMALSCAQFTDSLLSLPNSLETHLGDLEDDGVDLSGGQWQRIAIARACFLKSSFIAFDEPTASLDPVAESLMYHTFAEVLKDYGYILISHRLASAKLADRIIVMDDGQIVEDGKHEELMKQQGLYCKMFSEQSAWYVNTEEG